MGLGLADAGLTRVSTPGPPLTVFVIISNVNDELSAYRWSAFHAEVGEMLRLAGAKFLGEWYAGPTALWQNACWCVDIQPGIAERLKGEIGAIGANYGRGAVAWSEVTNKSILG